MQTYPPSAAELLSHSNHPAPAVKTDSLLTGFPPSAGPWKLWQKDLLASADMEKVSAEPGTLLNRNRLAAAAGLGRAGIVGTNLPDGLDWTRMAAGSVAEGQDLPGLELEAAGAGKGTAWMAVETEAKSKIPGMSRKKLGCGGEVVSVVTVAAHLGSVWKTESRSSIKVMQQTVHKSSYKAQDDLHSSYTQIFPLKRLICEVFLIFISLFRKEKLQSQSILRKYSLRT